MKKSIVGVLVALLAASTLGLPARAGAATTSFTSRARAAGYTAAQSATLQRKVDHLLAVVGGRQVAINEIAFPGGRILLPLPGENHARELDAASQSPYWHSNCRSGYVCLFSGVFYTGTEMDVSRCGWYYRRTVPWSTIGSWDNNQTGGAVASFYDDNNRLWGRTPSPRSWQVAADWNPVHTVVACY